MHSIRSHGSARSRRSEYRTETDRDYSTERDEPAPRLTTSLRRRPRVPEPRETDLSRERERELAAARDAEISELISRTRCLTMEVEEFVESMRNTVLNGRTREEGQKLYNESS
jgi:hypothetical protein